METSNIHTRSVTVSEIVILIGITQSKSASIIQFMKKHFVVGTFFLTYQAQFRKDIKFCRLQTDRRTFYANLTALTSFCCIVPFVRKHAEFASPGSLHVETAGSKRIIGYRQIIIASKLIANKSEQVYSTQLLIHTIFQEHKLNKF